MIHYQVLQHSGCCDIEHERCKKNALNEDYDFFHSFSHYRRCYSEFICFFINGEFIIIDILSCHLSFNHLDKKEKMINELLFNKKKRLKYNVNRAVSDYREWKNKTKRNILYNKMHSEINYIYSDNAGKEYYFTTDYHFGTYIFNHSEVEKEYRKTIDYLRCNNLMHLFPKIKELYYSNWLPYDISVNNPAFVVRTVNELISNIKTQIK